jgi:hypothetical protein
VSIGNSSASTKKCFFPIYTRCKIKAYEKIQSGKRPLFYLSEPRELHAQPVGTKHRLIVTPDFIGFPTHTTFGSEVSDEILGCLNPAPGIFVFSLNVLPGLFRAVFFPVADKAAARTGNICHQVLYLSVGMVWIRKRNEGQHECRQHDQAMANPSSHRPFPPQ